MLEAPIGRADLRSSASFSLWAPDVVEARLSAIPVTSAAWACFLPRIVERSADAAAAREVVQLAAEARARGAIRQWSALVRRYPAAHTGPLRALHGPPWDPALTEALTREVRDAILWRALGSRSDDLGAALPDGAGIAGETDCATAR